jgi:hypothetical protein
VQPHHQRGIDIVEEKTSKEKCSVIRGRYARLSLA